MNINDVTNYVGTTYSDSVNKANKKNDAESTASIDKDTAAVYEPSNGKAADPNPAKTYKMDTAKVQKMMAEVDSKTEQLRSLVEKMFGQQGKTLAKADDMWSFLSGGDFTVDEETRLQAQKDIAEDGYWGAESTSDRILDFAKALTGGDPDKIEEMKDAFIKGFKEATKTWGKELPELCQNTYDKVMEKFDAWSKED